MKNWTIQKRVAAGFGVVILLMLVICGFCIYRLEQIHTQTHELEIDHVPGLYLTAEVEPPVQEMILAALKLVQTDDATEKATLLQTIRDKDARASEIEEEMKPTISSEEERGLYNAVVKGRENVKTQVAAISNARDKAEALALYQSQVQPALKDYLTGIDNLQRHSKAEADTALSEISNGVRDTKYVTIGGSVIVLLVCVFVAMFVVRQLAATLKQLMLALIQVNGSATEMTATLKEQQVSANEVASTSVEIGATAKEISATTKELGKTMNDVASVAEQTAQLATGGQNSLQRLESTMRQIMGATSTISSKLAILNEKTGNINSVVTTINKVADQTNLLSLNAAIEAEKAGEYGQGFGVVATEIRRLADQTAVATYDIEQMVKEMQSAVSAGVMGMDKFAEEVRRGNEDVCGVTTQLVQIIQQIQALTPQFESVNDGMQTQSTAAGQISEALTQLGETAQQSAQALRQNTEAINQLTEAAQGLQSAVAQMKGND